MSQIKHIDSTVFLANNDIIRAALNSKLTSVTTMPTLTDGIVGNTYLYTGATTVDFTTNTIYKAISDGGDPATLSWQSIELGSTTISDVSALPTGSSIEDIFYRTETATPYTATVGTDFLDDNTNFTRTSNTYTAQSGVTIKASLDNGITYKDFTSLEFDGTDWTLTADGETATLSDGDTFCYEIINYSLYAGNSEKQITERIALYEDLPDGVIVDNELDITSSHAISNSATTTALNTKVTQYSTMPSTDLSDYENMVVQYIGETTTTDPIYTNGYFYKCLYNSTDDVFVWVNIPTQEVGAQTIVDTDTVPVSDIENVVYRVTDSVSSETSYYAGNETEAETERLAKYSDVQFIQVDTMETPSSELEGTIVQYVGVTTADYTNGFFYKCVSDGQDPATYSWEEIVYGAETITYVTTLPVTDIENIVYGIMNLTNTLTVTVEDVLPTDFTDLDGDSRFTKPDDVYTSTSGTDIRVLYSEWSTSDYEKFVSLDVTDGQTMVLTTDKDSYDIDAANATVTFATAKFDYYAGNADEQTVVKISGSESTGSHDYIGTKSVWNSMSASQKAEYSSSLVCFTDDWGNY